MGFISLTLDQSYWQNEYNKCLRGDDTLAADCIDQKRQRWWQFDLLYQNGSIGSPKYDQILKEKDLIKQ